MTTPAWLLLIWSGLGAALAAAIVALAIGGTSVASWSLAPEPRSRMHGATWSLLAGMFAYPFVYGLLFELFQRADFQSGLILGALHGAVMFARVKRDATVRAAIRAGAGHVAYGAAIGFLYVTP